MAVNPNAAQLAAFFGSQGQLSLDGGSRGRAFMISGLLLGVTPAWVVQFQQVMEGYGDGIARTLIDNTGFLWPNVVYRKEFQWAGKFGVVCDGTGVWCRPYRCIMHGLT